MEHIEFDALPAVLSAKDISSFLGVSIGSAYNLLHQKAFPSVRVGKRLTCPRGMFIAWYKEQFSKNN